MTKEEVKKELNNTYIHVYPDGENVACKIQGNSLLLLAMVDQVLTEIVDKNGADYDHALSLLKKLHDRPRRADDAINKILGDL
jgi:hypothetical protein